MKIQIHNGLRDPQVLEVTRVTVLDNFDNPLVAAVEIDNGIIHVETADNPQKFNAMLRALGITQTVFVEGIDQTPLPQIIIPKL